jgi:IS4 transposase
MTFFAIPEKMSYRQYPDNLRRVHFYDVENHNHLYFLTNNFFYPPLTIAKLYKCRWNMELFFKWIKQHIRIKAFYGLSENAVKTQIWIAIIAVSTRALVRIRTDNGLELLMREIWRRTRLGLEVFSLGIQT